MNCSPIELTPAEVRLLRTAGQHLHRPADRDALREVVRSVCAINAQFTPAMKLSLRARISSLEMANLRRALDDERTLARAWTLRGTLHLQDATDLPGWVALLGPTMIVNDKRRRAELGLTEAKLTEGLSAIRHILKDGEPLTKAELMDRLIEKGVDIDAKGQAPIHLIAYAALSGLVCLGPERENGKTTYVLMDTWLRDKSREETAVSLFRRYLEGYGPASIRDFAAWCGLSSAQIGRGWEQALAGEIEEVSVEGKSLWLQKSSLEHLNRPASPGPVVRLLPAFDSYVLGYADREYVVPPGFYKEVYHGGQTRPTVLVDGLVAGVWRYQRQGKRLIIEARPFDTFGAKVRDRIAEEVDDIGRFWQTQAKSTEFGTGCHLGTVALKWEGRNSGPDAAEEFVRLGPWLRCHSGGG